MKLSLLLIPIFLFLLASCSPDNSKKAIKSAFPKTVQRLDSLKQTVFLPTLETNVDSKKNAIYAASLLMAWDEIKNVIQEPIIKIESDELRQINQSKSHKDVLTKDEYHTELQSLTDHTIAVKASFKKALPFSHPLFKDSLSLKFNGKSVVSFGVDGSSEFVDIVYYNHDNDFALALKPKDRKHEIILVKTSFARNYQITNQLLELSNKEAGFQKARNPKNYWKYALMDEDKIRIPIIRFNIATNYTGIEGTHFFTQHKKREILTLYQRTAFVLNEKGAEVESETIMAVTDSTSAVMERPQPKNLIFDKPFLILLKRTDSKNPYFAMFVANNELMEKPSSPK